ncbi:MAG TPA: class I SAM-dependent methyltransferase [Chthoniobacterales bacterium]|jgi:2-polyprenyl-3-methyl-5-hydroxy-6-metoxy-1,4-benzoquinol methylase|nr:class I SAM-dependent methyltransferase [Chthoniobacterales bacterium]
MADQLTGLLSPFLRSRRIAVVRPFLGAGYLFDVGCGTGELAHDVDPTRYVGVDRDEESIAIARRKFPAHRFFTLAEFAASPRESQFDQIVGLAVIEHVDDPQQWLAWLRTLLKPDGRVILTTPHPSMRRVHELGARLGLFSREGAKEHRELIDRHRMNELAAASGFRIRDFRRFLLGCNQLFILERN